MATKKIIDLTQKETSIQCFCNSKTSKERGAVIGATDMKTCECIMIDGQGLGDTVRVDRVVVSDQGFRDPKDKSKTPFISTRTLKGVTAKSVKSGSPKFVNLEKFKIK